MTEYADPDLDVDPDSDLETIAPRRWPGPGSEDGARSGSDRGPVVAIAAALVVVSLVVGFAVATVVLNARDTGPAEIPRAGPTVPTPTVPARPVDPDEAVLGALILRQTDVVAPNTVRLLDHGADTTVATLDLCNGTFPSEALRTARRQVALRRRARRALRMSTEAVLYAAPPAARRPSAELKSVADKCPSTPVVSPVGEDTATTTFRAPPDATWPHTPTVERLAYDFVTNERRRRSSRRTRSRCTSGGDACSWASTSRSPTARRPRSTAAPRSPGIVAVFEARMAKVSDRVAAGTG